MALLTLDRNSLMLMGISDISWMWMRMLRPHSVGSDWFFGQRAFGRQSRVFVILQLVAMWSVASFSLLMVVVIRDFFGVIVVLESG
jgi:hypothetical protein